MSEDGRKELGPEGSPRYTCLCRSRYSPLCSEILYFTILAEANALEKLWQLQRPLRHSRDPEMLLGVFERLERFSSVVFVCSSSLSTSDSSSLGCYVPIMPRLRVQDATMTIMQTSLSECSRPKATVSSRSQDSQEAVVKNYARMPCSLELKIMALSLSGRALLRDLREIEELVRSCWFTNPLGAALAHTLTVSRTAAEEATCLLRHKSTSHSRRKTFPVLRTYDARSSESRRALGLSSASSKIRIDPLPRLSHILYAKAVPRLPPLLRPLFSLDSDLADRSGRIA